MNPIKRAVYETAVKALGHKKAEAARIHFKNSYTELSKLISTLGPEQPGVDIPGLLLDECKKLKKELGVQRIALLVNETSSLDRYTQLPLQANQIELITFDLFLSAWAKRKGMAIRFANDAALLSADVILVDHAAAEEEFLNALRACARLDKTIPVLALLRSQIAARSTQGTFWYGGNVKTYAYFFNYFSSFYQIKESFQLHVKVTGPDGKVYQKTIWIHPDCHCRIGGEEFGLPSDATRLYQFEYKAFHPRFRFTSNRIRFGFDIVTPESVACLHSLEIAAHEKVLYRLFDSTDLRESPVLTFRAKKPDPVKARLSFHIGEAAPLEVSAAAPSEGGPVRRLSPRDVLLKSRPSFAGKYTVEVQFEDAIEQLEAWNNDLTVGKSQRIGGNHVISAAKPRTLPEKRLSSADIEAVAASGDISFVGYAVPLFHRRSEGLDVDSEVSFHTQSQQPKDEWWAHLKLVGPNGDVVERKLVKQGLIEAPLNLNRLFEDALASQPAGDFVVLVEPKLDANFDSIKAYGETNPEFRLINRNSGDSDAVELQGGFAVNLPGYMSPFPTGYSGRYSNKNRTNIISRLVARDSFDTYSTIVYRTHANGSHKREPVRFELLLADGSSKGIDLEISPNSMIVMSTAELKKRLGIHADEDYFWLRVTSSSCSLTGYSIVVDRSVGSVGLQHFWGA